MVTQDEPWTPTVCRQSVSGTLSLPLSGCFSPFPHGTSSLSVMHEYLGLEGGPPISDRISRVPPYSRTMICITRTGLSPTMALLSRRFRLSHHRHWPGPGSLATTAGVSVDVLSYGYLDVSVPRVRHFTPILFRVSYLLSILGNHSSRLPCYSDFPSTLGGFPHSEIYGSKGIRTSP